MVGERAPRASRSSRRWWWPLLGAVALLSLVAVGSLREAPGSGGGAPRFPSALLQTLGLLAAVTIVAAGVLASWTLLPGHRPVPQRRRSPLYAPMLLIGFVLLLALFRRLGWLDRLRFLPGLRPGPSPTAPAVAGTGPDGRLTSGDPGWIPFVVVGLLLAGLAAAIIVRGEQARRRRAALAGSGRQLAELLEVTQADLEAEPDPRRAVIAAWIRMEGGLAHAGLPRHAAEAPLEYVARVLERASVRSDSVRCLADLFERAKFSQHAIDERMRAQAIEAVATIRAELEAEQARAASAGERPGAEREADPSSAAPAGRGAGRAGVVDRR
jgi:Domain of unknown function (DUF4129)